MFIEERHREILKRLNASGTITTAEIQRLFGIFTPVNLMEHFTVLDKQNSRCGACRFYGVCYHENGLSAGINLLEKLQKFI